ncbi:MAG: SDR family oxidoreductase [Deltaproteobacteria bacterium]|nr:SDR family oxidoreductase [Deltaproteobacteria bacterium]
MSTRRVAFVTGGGRGIGAEVARQLASRGIAVALAARTRTEVENVATELRAKGAHALAIGCDVTRAHDVDAAATATERELGPIDVLVNNAGVAARTPLIEMDEETWDAVVDTSLKGAYLATRRALPGMLARGRGRIVTVSSISGTLGTARMTAYCAAKWGLIGFTKALAEETRDTGVVVSVVLPGSTDTAMLRGSGFPPRMTPADVASTIAYLACDAPAATHGGSFELFG